MLLTTGTLVDEREIATEIFLSQWLVFISHTGRNVTTNTDGGRLDRVANTIATPAILNTSLSVPSPLCPVPLDDDDDDLHPARYQPQYIAQLLGHLLHEYKRQNTGTMSEAVHPAGSTSSSGSPAPLDPLPLQMQLMLPEALTRLTATSIAQAKGVVLQQWIDQINSAAAELERSNSTLAGRKPRKQKPLARTGRVDALRKRLASYLRLDLSGAATQDSDTADATSTSASASLPASGTTPHGASTASGTRPQCRETVVFKTNLDIRLRQWAYLRALSREWKETLKAGKEFLLLRKPLPGTFSSFWCNDDNDLISGCFQRTSIISHDIRYQQCGPLRHTARTPCSDLVCQDLWLRQLQDHSLCHFKQLPGFPLPSLPQARQIHRCQSLLKPTKTRSRRQWCEEACRPST